MWFPIKFIVETLIKTPKNVASEPLSRIITSDSSMDILQGYDIYVVREYERQELISEKM